MVQTVFKYRLLLAAILLAAAGLRLFNLDYDLPEVYEEATPMIQALEMWASEDEPFDFNPHFFNYPSLYFYIQFLGQAIYYGANVLTGRFSSTHDMLALHEQDPSELVLLARVITALFGLGAVWAVYLLGSRMAGPRTGLIAATVLTVLPAHVAASRTILVDTPLVFFVALALRGMLQVLDGGRRSHALLSGFWIGLAVSSKYTGALLVLPLVVVFALRIHRGGAKPWATLRLPDLWIGIGAAAFTFIVTSPYCLLDFKAFWADLSYERTHMTIGHFRVDPTTTIPSYLTALWHNLGIWLSPFVLAGVVQHLRRIREGARQIPLLLFCFTYLAIIFSWTMNAEHYLLPVFPCLALFAAEGIREIWSRWDRAAFPGWGAILLAVLLALPIGIESARTWTFHTELDPRSAAKAWIESNVAPGAIFAKEVYTPSLADRTYSTVLIPIHVYHPEFSFPFYNLGWFVDVDYIVTSSFVSDRYTADPERFPKQVAFYEALERELRLAAEFSGETGGPRIRIYQNPKRESRAPDALIDSTLYSSFYRDVVWKNPSAGKFLRALWMAFAKKNWYTKANDVARWFIRLRDPDVYELDTLGHEALKQGDLVTAIEAWRQAIQADSTIVNLYTNLGVAYARVKRYDLAAEAWEQGLRLAPKASNLFVNLAKLYKAQKRYDRSEEIYSKAIRLRPDNVEAAIELAEIYRIQDRPEKAVEVLNAALRAAPDREEIRSQLEALLEKR